MLQYQLADGSIFYLNHLISFVFIIGYVVLLFKLFYGGQVDKVKHSGVCAGIMFVILNVLGLIHMLSLWWVAPVITLAIGIGKEFVDLLNPKKHLFDWYDILADTSGIAIITIVYICSFLLYVDM
jgi:hypothetical protein